MHLSRGFPHTNLVQSSKHQHKKYNKQSFRHLRPNFSLEKRLGQCL